MHLRPSAVSIVCLSLLASSALGQLVPKVGAIFPEGGQRGTTASITFYGENVSPLTSVVFAGDPGLSAEVPEPIAPAVNLLFSRGGIEPTKPPSNFAPVRIVIAPDASPGPREIRVVTAEGISNSVKFFVGDIPELMENESSDSVANAQGVTFPLTVTGRVHPENDHDFYSFDAEAGKTLVFDLFSSRNQRPLDAVMFLHDSTDKVVAQSEDENGFDPMLTFQPREAGRYTLEVRDTRFKGGPDYSYRLSMGILSRLESVFPLAVQTGTDATLSFSGTNLGANTSLALSIRPDAPLGLQDVRVSSTTISNARRFEVTDLPVAAETEPDDTSDKAMGAALPSVINGRIDKPGDMDVFRFKIEARQFVLIELGASMFDSDLDAVLTLTDSEGKTVSQNDDTDGLDGRIAQVLKPGDYTLSIRDLLDRGGETFAYRLRLSSPQPEFRVDFFPDAPVLHRGGTTIVRAQVRRTGGYYGPVEIGFENLPAGIMSESALVSPEEGSDLTLIALRAADDAPLGPHPLEMTSWATINGQRLRRPVQAIQVDNVFAPRNQFNPAEDEKRVDKAFIFVIEAAPFKVEPVSIALSTFQGQGTSAEANVIRSPGFNGDVSVTVEGFTSRRDSIARNAGIAAANVPANQTRAAIAINANANSETGTRLVTFVATSAINGRVVTQMSQPIPLTIAEIPFMLTGTLTNLAVTALPESSASAAREAVFSIKAERHGWFTEEIPLSIEGVPEGVTAEISPIARDTDEAQVRLVASEQAKTGTTATLVITGKSSIGGREYTHRAGNITLAINAPEADAGTAAAPAEATAHATEPPKEG